MSTEDQELNIDDDVIDVETPEEKPIVERNLFFANDAFNPPPANASLVDKIRYQQIKESVKRLRKLERNTLFKIKQMDVRAQVEKESNDS